MRLTKGFLKGFLCGAATLPLLVLGFGVGAGPAETYKQLEIFSKVLHYVENNYVEAIPAKTLLYGAINGIVNTLDPHSSFMTPENYRRLKEDTRGKFGGVGIEVGTKDGYLVIVSPIDGSPAARAGLKPGDLIVAIDGVPTVGISSGEAVDKIKGAEGSTIVLTVAREGWEIPREITLTRETITVKSVTGQMLDGGIAYAKISSFQERTSRDLERLLDQFDRETGINGLVLDVRNNPGGLFEQAVRIVDDFVETGVIVSTVGRDGQKGEEELARKRGTRREFPIIVLVNEGSASASEIVAGALQDHKRAVILGTQSFGKGSVQTIIELDDGSGLKLTIAKYLTPSGRSIQDKGVTPDFVVPAQADPRYAEAIETFPADDAEFAVATGAEGALRSAARHAEVVAMLEKDYQLRRAVDLFKVWSVFGDPTRRKTDVADTGNP